MKLISYSCFLVKNLIINIRIFQPINKLKKDHLNQGKEERNNNKLP